MIQRIQSLYLFLTTILPLLFLKLRILKYADSSGSGFYMGFNGLYSSGTDQLLTRVKPLWLVTLLLALISLISLLTLFLFRKRKLQIKFCLLVIVLSAGLIMSETVYSILIIREFQVEIKPGFAMIIPLIILVLSILAWRGIKKDEDLVRSYDRLR